MLRRPHHTIDADEVHVWHVNVDCVDSAGLDAMGALLSPQEIARMQQFGQERDRLLFLLSRGLMRSVLASYLRGDGAALQFGATAFGKPILDANGAAPLCFNLTHSRGAVALAVSREREVGVDIEERRRRVDYVGLAKRYFAADEARHLESLVEEQRADAFVAIWTLKEAYVKGIGRGLMFPLDAFAFDLDISRLIGFRPLADFVACDWQFQQFDLGERHCGAVAVQGSGVSIEMRDWAAAFFDV